MNRRNGLETLFGKRLRALVRNLPSARAGDVKALHRTRVASRRVREALPLLDGRMSPDKLSKVRRDTRRLTRALGAVRELDVALLLLDEIEPTVASDEAIARVREQVTRAREARRADMLARLHEVKPDKVVRKIAGRLDDLKSDHRSSLWQAALRKRIRSRAGRLLEAMTHAGLIYLPDRLHAVRIAVKKLRYGLELAGESGAGSTAGAVKTLKRVQETLGRLHDVEVLIGHVQVLRADIGPEAESLAQALDTLIASLEEECRELHARYLDRRAAVERVAEGERGAGSRRTWTVSGSSTSSTAADRKRTAGD